MNTCLFLYKMHKRLVIRFVIAMLICDVLLTVLESHAQVSLTRNDSILVKKDNAVFFKNPWAGGLNAPQFSPIDLNGDGIKDLFVYERDYNGRVLTFINNGIADSVDYTYAPEYESKFPAIHNWALLVDYNCDGRNDIFNWVSGGMTVYRNDFDMIDGLKFTLVSSSNDPWTPAVTTQGTLGAVNLYLSPLDLPAITDIDNDGDIDVLSYCLGCPTVEFNKNYSMENYGVCDSLDFVIEEKCWGFFTENLLNNTIELGISCKTGKKDFDGSGLLHPGGSSMLALDINGDNAKELVLGNINSNEHIMLVNGGDLNNANMISLVPNFPSNSVKVNIPTFPASYYLDVNNDGLRDLISAPNTTSSVRNFTSCWYYKNEGSANAPIFNYVKEDFLQGEMIEIGEGAYPVFFDHNSDGLMDIVIGNYGYWGASGNYDGKLSLYENYGSASTPAFELITRDYQGLSSLSLNGLYPAFGDMDDDGDIDMIIGDYEGFLHYFDNSSGAGNTAAFSLITPNYMGIDIGQFAAPQIIDVNRDGLLDLLVGERGGKIKYFENIGTLSTPYFKANPTIEAFGGIDVMIPCCTGYSIPFLTSLEPSGEYFLFVASEEGWIHLYGNIEGDLYGNFSLVDSMVSDLNVGLRTSISCSDINNDGALDVIIGNYRGGVSMFSFSGDPVIAMDDLHNPKTDILIYPNPSKNLLKIKIDGRLSIESVIIYDLLGTVVISELLLPGEELELDLKGLKPGLYLVKVHGEDGKDILKKLILE
ncbi:MAG TPA: T9SS type A sorting domain-containing protein [Flavobacteriales bacterium]|nr:T9SS type A sorting domain-containing protein [Flavobacteriales bacterium]